MSDEVFSEQSQFYAYQFTILELTFHSMFSGFHTFHFLLLCLSCDCKLGFYGTNCVNGIKKPLPAKSCEKNRCACMEAFLFPYHQCKLHLHIQK